MLKQILSALDIRQLVDSLAFHITKLHDPCVWIVMDGSFMFGADLLRQAKGISSVQFFYIDRGYGEPGGPHDPHVYHVSHEPVFLTKYTHVIVDVIVETGKTFEAILNLVPERQRKSVITCALIVKGDDYKPSLLGVQLDSAAFLTGYGMLPYRNLGYIAERQEK